MAQTSELVGRKAKFVMGTKLAKGGQYNFTLQNLKKTTLSDFFFQFSNIYIHLQYSIFFYFER